MTTFIEKNPVLVELVRELDIIRRHNKNLASENKIQFWFAEAALICMTMENFLRAIIDNQFPGTFLKSLHNVLEFAVSHDLILLPWDNQQEGIVKICAIRNTYLHTNINQAIIQANCSSMDDYIKNQFGGEIEGMFKITDWLMKQIDFNTGHQK